MFLRVALAGFLDEAQRRSAATTLEGSADLLDQFFRRRGFLQRDIFVITTNYDLVLEGIFELIFGEDSWCHPGLATESECGDRIPIFKLHGSINWMEDRGPAATAGASRPSAPRILQPSSLSLVAVRHQTFGYYFVQDERKYTPVLVPPLYQKEHWFRNDNESWSRIFRQAWNEAFTRLRASTSCLFWGYSLPSADLDMFSKFMEVLVPSSRNAQVEIVDNCTDTRMIRLGRYLNPPATIDSDGLESFLTPS
jgi:hypothetical protein